MRKIILLLSIIAVLQFKAEAQHGGNYISFQTFYDQLSPYGIWAYYPEYGGYVWAPNAGRHFKPYGTNGRWVYTHYGWTWISNYRWGWAPFHYGRWFYDDWRGWLWLPGYDWAPAWVAWGSQGGNYGWAPLGPNITININFGWRPPSQMWWTFVPRNRFGSNNWQQHTVRNNTTVVNNNITIINNVYNGRQGSERVSSPWMRGPEVGQVERETRTRIRPMEIVNSSQPDAGRVSNNKIAIYRPPVDKRPEARPGKIETFDKLRPVSKLPEKEPENNFVRPVAPRPRPTQPGTRPINPTPSPKPAPNPRPTSPVTRPVVNPQPAPKPVTRPETKKPVDKAGSRPAPKPTPVPRKAGE